MKWLKNLDITRSFFYSFVLLVLLFAVHGFFSLESIRLLTGLTRTIHDHPLVVSNAALRANINIIKMHRSMKDVVLFDDPEVFEAAASMVDTLENETYEQLRIVQENILGPEGEKIASDAVLLFSQWKPIRDRVIRMTRNGDRKNAAEITKGEGAAHVDRLEGRMLELTAYARNKAANFLRKTETVSSRTQKASFLFIIAWGVLLFSIAFFTLRRARFLEKEVTREKEWVTVTLKSIGDGVIATDRTGKVVMMNKIAETLTGWRENEGIGQNIRNVFNIINEQTREPSKNPIEKILATGAVVGLANHTILIARDGSERAIADSGAPIRSKTGEIIGIVLVFRDQTEERNYQNQILASENRYRLLSENTLDLIWAMNLDLEFTYVNPAIFSLTGYSPEEWIGTRLPEHFDEESFEKISRIIEAELARGPESKGVILETAILDRNRKPVPIEVHGRIIHDNTGRPVGIQGTTRDITERKRAEAELHYQDLLLREMGSIARIGAWEFDPVTGNGTWTEEVARIHDLDPGVATNVELGMSFYQGESRARIEKAINDAIKLGIPYDLELEMVSAKGVRKWVRSIGQPKIENGRIVQIRGSFQDITEQKRSEQHIEHLNKVLKAIREVNKLIVHERDPGTIIRECCRLLVDNRGYSSSLIVLTDENDRPLAWSGAGIAATSRELETRLAQGIIPSCCEGLEGGVKVILTDDRGDICRECPIAGKCSGSHSLCVNLIHDSESFGYLIVALSYDLSVDNEEMDLLAEIAKDISYSLKTLELEKSRRKSKEKSAVLERQLIQAQKMESVGRLAGGVAHDYNNMLGVIIGNAEMALDQLQPGDPLQNELEEIFAAAKRSAEITRQLLAFARQQTIAPRLLDLNETVESLLQMIRRLIGEDIDVAWLPAPGLGPVKIDPTQVDQILANLCVNARDAISGVGRITIETENVSFDEEYCADHAECIPGDYVLLAVSDDGSGMTQETMAQIFEPFFTTKELGRGTGLGLSTVYGIVKQNHGFINLYSEPEKGTTFKIYLPRHSGETGERLNEAAAPVPSGSGETVLLVEDELAILNLGKRILESLGYNVLGAGTPGRAIELAEHSTDTIHLLITDVVMPEMNGRDLANHLKISRPELKILFMSGYTANTIAHQGVLDDGVHFIQKPFTKRKLAVKLREVLTQKKTA